MIEQTINQMSLVERNRNQGVALIMVLFILAIASIAIISMSVSRQLDNRRTENLLRSTQAFEYAYSLESWASKILRDELLENQLDSYDDNWSQPLPETAIPGGTITAQLYDLQGRFNLNNLADDNPKTALANATVLINTVKAAGTKLGAFELVANRTLQDSVTTSLMDNAGITQTIVHYYDGTYLHNGAIHYQSDLLRETLDDF